jgi:hypothetical protein
MLVYIPELAVFQDIHVSELKLRKSGKFCILMSITAGFENGLCVVSASTSLGCDVGKIVRLACIWRLVKLNIMYDCLYTAHSSNLYN